MSQHNDDPEDWNTYRRLVLDNQELFRAEQGKQREDITNLRLQIAKWAGGASLVFSVVVALILKALETIFHKP